MRLGIDPTVDLVFKRLFGTEENAGLLIHFLNAILAEEGPRRIVSVEFLNPAHDRETEDDKLVIVDLRVHDQSGRQIIVEMQVVVHKAFRERLLYYWARDFVVQLGAKDDYRSLTPTILVCVVVGELFRGSTEYRHRFRLVSDDHRIVFSEHLEVHTLELGKFRQPVERVATSLERWSFFMKHAENLDATAIPESLDEPEIHRAVEVLNMISQSERDRVEYEIREKRRRDQINREEMIREGALEEGLERGREEGERVGEDRGVIIGKIQLLQGMLNEPVTARDAFRHTPLDELNAKFEQLQTRLRERTGASE